MEECFYLFGSEEGTAFWRHKYQGTKVQRNGRTQKQRQRNKDTLKQRDQGKKKHRNRNIETKKPRYKKTEEHKNIETETKNIETTKRMLQYFDKLS